MKLIYISGADAVAPERIKSALDEIRKNLNLPADTVLFGLPVDGVEAAAAPAIAVNESPAVGAVIKDNKVLQFPAAKKKSILSVIKTHTPKPAPPPAVEIEDEVEEITLPDNALPGVPLMVDDADADFGERTRSITDLMNDMPGMDEDEPEPKPNLVEEFGDFLNKERDAEHDAAPKKIEKTPRPFGRKTKGPLNLLGDLFSYAGMAANDDVQDFVLPDFIKRP